MRKNESIMQRLKKGTTAVHFSARKKLKKRHHPLKKTFYEHLEYYEH
jgi:hypothetical protein